VRVRVSRIVPRHLNLPHAGCPRSHFTFRVLQLHLVNSTRSITPTHNGRHIRLAAHRERPFPLARGGALAAIDGVLVAGALIAPRMRGRRVLRELRCAVGAADLLWCCSAVGSRCRAHGGFLTGASLLGRAGVFGEAETETWRTRWGYGRLASFPTFRN
jgi:hypothetical protein